MARLQLHGMRPAADQAAAAPGRSGRTGAAAESHVVGPSSTSCAFWPAGGICGRRHGARVAGIADEHRVVIALPVMARKPRVIAPKRCATRVVVGAGAIGGPG